MWFVGMNQHQLARVLWKFMLWKFMQQLSLNLCQARVVFVSASLRSHELTCAFVSLNLLVFQNCVQYLLILYFFRCMFVQYSVSCNCKDNLSKLLSLCIFKVVQMSSTSANGSIDKINATITRVFGGHVGWNVCANCRSKAIDDLSPSICASVEKGEQRLQQNHQGDDQFVLMLIQRT